MNFFEFYEFPEAYSLDEKDLRQKYLNNSRLYHPDRFVFQSAELQSEAEEKAAFNNKAFLTLLDPQKRLQYMLELSGQLRAEETYALDPDFLMTMVDIHDMILGEPEKALESLSALESALDIEYLPLLDEFDLENSSVEFLNKLKDYFYKKRYLLKARENIRSL
jgi:molecular chaperone HscB